jgi:hypothetical protein
MAAPRGPGRMPHESATCRRLCQPCMAQASVSQFADSSGLLHKVRVEEIRPTWLADRSVPSKIS